MKDSRELVILEHRGLALYSKQVLARALWVKVQLQLDLSADEDTSLNLYLYHYSWPSLACRRQHYEFPVLDYRRYEKGVSIFYTLNRHPNSPLSDEQW